MRRRRRERGGGRGAGRTLRGRALPHLAWLLWLALLPGCPRAVRLPPGEVPAETLALDDGVRLRGAGAGTVIVGSLHVPRGRAVSLEAVTVRPEAGAHALRVEGTLHLSGVRVEGGRSALRVAGGTAQVDGFVATDVETGVWVVDGEVDARGLEVDGARRACVLARRADVRLRGGHLHRCEYGVLGGPGSRITLSALRIEDVAQAGVGLPGGRAALHDVSVRRAGPGGGVQANDLEGPLRLRGVRVSASRGAGLQVIRGPIDAAEVDLSAAAGHGAYLEDVRGRIEGLRIRGSGEAGLAISGGVLWLSGVSVEGAGDTGLALWYGAQVEARGLDASSITVREGARLRLDAASVATGLRITCDGGGRVTLLGARGGERLLCPTAGDVEAPAR